MTLTGPQHTTLDRIAAKHDARVIALSHGSVVVRYQHGSVRKVTPDGKVRQLAHRDREQVFA